MTYRRYRTSRRGARVLTFVAFLAMIMIGVEAGAPRSFAWTAAFGLTVTLVWMYLEFLRLIAILRGSE